jgi:predicted alpha/beta hydrolase
MNANTNATKANATKANASKANASKANGTKANGTKANAIKAETVEYAAKDNTRAALQIFTADDAGAPVVMCLPAMGVRGSYYTEFAEKLSRAGYHVVVSDLRGIGSSSVRPSRDCDFGYNEILTLDLPALVETVRQRFPSNDRLLLGHSLGGQLGALYLSANPEAARALILIAAGSVYYKGWPFPGRLRVLFTAILLRAMGMVLGYVPGAKVGFAGTEARTLVADWSNNCFTGKYVIAGSNYDYEGSLRRIVKPVLAVSFERDGLAPARSVENLLSKLSAAVIVHRCFSAACPGLEKAVHFSWVKRAEVVVATVQGWAENNNVLNGSYHEPATDGTEEACSRIV